ncbi:hypothetical protein Rhe02_91350 [Rhizocola hellebori]|uniref:Uncharacterized protein n=1 Tax=Rhizocola hellebori TaxID=1392758 RepID=A0A8J3VMC4_9ACTN|nr:hypothetical protein Rhe02_91350 [Rhizocola hellebori]
MLSSPAYTLLMRPAEVNLIRSSTIFSGMLKRRGIEGDAFETVAVTPPPIRLRHR